jgi:hypothetical protein
MTLLAVFFVLHGSIHLMGFAKAFGFADLPQLAQPITRAAGMLWLAAAALFVATAVSIFVVPRWWWAVGLIAIAASMIAIIGSWQDARFGTAANLLALAAVTFGFLASGPWSLRATYDRDVSDGLAAGASEIPLDEADLAHLPAPVRRYLLASRVVGKPRVHNFRVKMRGRFRSGPTARWIPIAAEQHNFIDRPARFFYLTGSMFMIPVQGYHRYAEGSATMNVKAAAVVPVAASSGTEMTRAETVTMFNDMCVMAPATLVHPSVVWEGAGRHSAVARFTNAGHTIRAELQFNDADELVNFWSDDRSQTMPDGAAKQARWSTPLGAYRWFGDVRLAGGGAALWHEPNGPFAYIELTIEEVEYNVGTYRRARGSTSAGWSNESDAGSREHDE